MASRDWDGDRCYLEVGDRRYEVLDQTGVYDYSWSEFALLRGPDGLLYVTDDSGCSCTSFGDGIDASTIYPVKSWHEATERLLEWAQGASPQEQVGAIEFVQRLAASSPPSRL